MTNDALRQIMFGAYSFRETEDGWLQAFQYSDAQMAVFGCTDGLFQVRVRLLV